MLDDASPDDQLCSIEVALVASGEKVEMKWIDCKQELPEERLHVLVCTDSGIRAISHWFCWFPEKGDKPLWSCMLPEFGEVTHWQPLDAPPTNSKGGESSGQ
jgi:hypothetical protein